MSVLLVSATNSSDSINRKVMDMVLLEKSFEHIDLTDYSDVPIFSKDIQDRGAIPKDILELYEKIGKHSKLVFFAPEHNGYISAYFKNIVDWLSIIRIDFLSNKKVMFVSVSETKRDKRAMEAPVATTFGFFAPSIFSFVNFNKYGLDSYEDIRRSKEIAESIEKF